MMYAALRFNNFLHIRRFEKISSLRTSGDLKQPFTFGLIQFVFSLQTWYLFCYEMVSYLNALQIPTLAKLKRPGQQIKLVVCIPSSRTPSPFKNIESVAILIFVSLRFSSIHMARNHIVA